MSQHVRRRRFCKLTPEGWAYLVILCFIAVGAVLRNVNLLIATTGMLVIPLLFNWRVCANLQGRLRGRRMVPDRIHAGESVNINWHCENHSRRLTARNVMVHDKVHQDGDESSTGSLISKIKSLVYRTGRSAYFRTAWPSNYAHACFGPISPGDTTTCSFKCRFPARGEHLLESAVISCSWPFGLISCRSFIDSPETVLVAPTLGHLRPTWEQRIDSMEIGDRSRKRRIGLEEDLFFALRKWRSGDSRKNVHWRSTARLGYPVVKQFDQPNDRDFALALDLHEQDETTRTGCELILSFAATAVSQLSAEVHGQLAVGICGEEEKIVTGRHTPHTSRNVMRSLATATPKLTPQIDSTIVELASRVSSGTPIYCLSTRRPPEWLSTSDEDQLSPSLLSVRHLVRWLEVESPEFNDLFSIETCATDTDHADTVESNETLVAEVSA